MPVPIRHSPSTHDSRLTTLLLDTGYCLASESTVIRGGRRRPIACHAPVALLHHPAHGWTLFDTGYAPRLLDAARRGRLVRIGDGQNRVDLTYVDNVAHALLLALDAPAAIGGTYTITNGEHPRLWDVIGTVLRGVGLPDRLRAVPLPAALAAATLLENAARVTGREPTLTRYSAAILARTQTYDITAARRDLGYTPPITLADGIARTLAALHAGA